MTSKVFEYVIVYHPTEAEAEHGEAARIVVDLARVIAKDKESVKMLAHRAIPKEFESNLDNIEVLIRPFDRGPCWAPISQTTMKPETVPWKYTNDYYITSSGTSLTGNSFIFTGGGGGG